MDFILLIQIAFFAVAISHVVTGSLIGYPVRVVGYLTTKWCPFPIGTVFFCPYCNAWWMGAGIGAWTGLPWQNIVQCAFTSCVLAAIVNAQWGLAADDRAVIAAHFEKEYKNGVPKKRSRSSPG